MNLQLSKEEYLLLLSALTYALEAQEDIYFEAQKHYSQQYRPHRLIYEQDVLSCIKEAHSFLKSKDYRDLTEHLRCHGPVFGSEQN